MFYVRHIPAILRLYHFLHCFDVSENSRAPFDLIYIDDTTDMRFPGENLQNENSFFGFKIFWNTLRNQQASNAL